MTQSSMAPRISVVMCTYNGAEVIGEAIRSMLGQTRAPDEVIVVDDGSKDRTAEVLREFGSSIVAVTQANGGIAAARNTGMRRASGDLIALMDHDDIALPRRLEIQSGFLARHPEVALCASDFSAFDENGPVSPSHEATYYSRAGEALGGIAARFSGRGGSFELDGADRAAPVPYYAGDVYEQIVLGNFMHPPTLMFRRELWRQAGEFDGSIGHMCDWDWLCRAARQGAFAFLQLPLLDYRLSATQVSRAGRSKTSLSSLAVAQRLFEGDPDLRTRLRGPMRALLGELSLDAAYSIADLTPARSWRLLASSVFRHGHLTRDTGWVAARLLLPRALRRVLRGSR